MPSWHELPNGRFEGANRYATDDEEVLTLWRDGQTWDVRVDREAERIRTEARERVLHAFYTGGRLDPRTATTDDIRAMFDDVMLALEPGKAEVEAGRRRADAEDSDA